jgi:aminomethyltransferase
MTELRRTVLYDQHIAHGASMVEFGGWLMPVQYPTGIIEEHLFTRRHSGIFDVSHMGRFKIDGLNALAFLQYVLSNNAAALRVGESQYTLIPDESGAVIDDAYLYRFLENEYLLVVNAANRLKDWKHLSAQLSPFPDARMTDVTEALSMISLQGPHTKEIISSVITSGCLPEPMRNQLSTIEIQGQQVFIGRTGYTGEPLCFELFVEKTHAESLWKIIIQKGAKPIGLGARDTLRLEAGLPLYGHELGLDPQGNAIPAFACPLSRFAVSFSPLKGSYIGRPALWRQFQASQQFMDRRYDWIKDLPRRIMALSVIEKGIARAGSPIFREDRLIGHITSGTMVPYWEFEGQGLKSIPTDRKAKRAICLGLIDSDLNEGDTITIDIRGKRTRALIVPYHLRSEAPPFARPIICQPTASPDPITAPVDRSVAKVTRLIKDGAENTRWRQQTCINLIPSEQTPSAAVRLLSVLDPAGRYAEHKPVKAFCEAEVFYYQGTEFIANVEQLLVEEMSRYLGCSLMETRPVSGQMANTALFSAMVDYLNRSDRKSEQRRMRSIVNHHIIKGGHLSAQPMGALRDFVARDPETEKPAVINFPVLSDNPYQIDLAACRDILSRHRPELVILGKSMTLHREPVAQLRQMIDELSPDTVLMYDMAHVLGLVGPYFQLPFAEGADIVTGSTHKTFFGTQRGVIAADFAKTDARYELWEAILRRSFPGSVSNHHLGSLLGLLMAAYEMNAFKDPYQQSVLANAKVFARALKDLGLDVAGDPAIGFTETHQVILNVGYAKGPNVAKRLEANHIIVNYQAAPDEEGFSAAGSLRMGVAEMTRFGMAEPDFKTLAQFIHDVIAGGKDIRDEVADFRRQFMQMKYCFEGPQIDALIQELHQLI